MNVEDTYEEMNMMIKFEFFFSIEEMNKWIREERSERIEERGEEGGREERNREKRDERCCWNQEGERERGV